jgi:hypothetical protein
MNLELVFLGFTLKLLPRGFLEAGTKQDMPVLVFLQ